MGPARFAVWSTLLCLVVSLGLLPLGLLFGLSTVLWALTGFWIVGLIGIVGGAWVVDAHGSTGPAFPAALATCILARLVFAGIGAAAAATRGFEALYAFFAGAGAAYLPLQVFEFSWLLSKDRLRT